MFTRRYFVFLFVSLSVCLSLFLSVCLSLFLSVCLSLFLSVCLSVCLLVTSRTNTDRIFMKLFYQRCIFGQLDKEVIRVWIRIYEGFFIIAR